MPGCESYYGLHMLTESQVLVDGPSKNPNLLVDRHAAALGNLILTPIVIPKLPRAAGRGAVAKAWEQNEVEQKWDESAWAKRRALREKRRGLSDFERFKVLRLTKQVRCVTRNNAFKERTGRSSVEPVPQLKPK